MSMLGMTATWMGCSEERNPGEGAEEGWGDRRFPDVADVARGGSAFWEWAPECDRL
jgi:hypothetical protein